LDPVDDFNALALAAVVGECHFGGELSLPHRG